MRRVMTALALAGLTVVAACGEPQTSSQPTESAATVASNWSLSPAQSRIAFASVKAERVGEGHRFKAMTGSVDPNGAFTLVIPLDSVETNIDVRNERMREFLFETVTFPNAQLTGQVDVSAFQTLAPGSRSEALLEGELNLHGVAAPIEARVLVTRLGDNKIAVETIEPVLIETGAFGLDAGVEKLRELAGLPAISPVVPVTANLVFER